MVVLTVRLPVLRVVRATLVSHWHDPWVTAPQVGRRHVACVVV